MRSIDLSQRSRARAHGLVCLPALVRAVLFASMLAAPAAPTLAQPVSNVEGPYVGTLPCADCDGVVTELTLLRDAEGRPQQYRLRETYLTRRPGEREFTTQGPWQALRGVPGNPQADRVLLAPAADAPARSFVRLSRSVIELLDGDGRRIASPANHQLVLDRRAARAAPVSSRSELFAGTVRRLPDRRQWQFVPCRRSYTRRAIDASPGSAIGTVLDDLGLERRNTMYVEAFGRVRDGIVQFERLNRAGAEMGCAAAGGIKADRFHALGQEPAWSLRGTGERLAYRGPGGPLTHRPARLTWRWAGDRIDAAAARVDSLTASGALSATLIPGICRDTMADAAYGFRAQLQLTRPQPLTLTGCAYLGAESVP